MTTTQGENPRHAAAVLRVILALKRDPDADMETVMERVIRETGVEPRAFRAFFAEHMEIMSRSMAPAARRR